MTWQEIYNKHNSDLMLEFVEYCYKDWGNYSIVSASGHMSKNNIKDIWGYLICFMDTKINEIQMSNNKYRKNQKQFTTIVKDENDNFAVNVQIVTIAETATSVNKVDNWHIHSTETLEQAMLWCATKFFEINEKVENETK